ncbi:hypothetical protein QWY28_01675 [Nocardioides sp. SOB77]|uniref:Uncharacterized protein n=1 Tax=Nocardioides oceani TaxID=3058369 RepID=A0ABT8FAG0_9ACTN|nr:hypothetical protein [Nocardioides oceani]MDN4171643.1 hypothetical protein [Nocardioides oceani]
MPEQAEHEHEQGHDGTGAAAELPPESVEAVEAERRERLDPENRPDNVEVDNTGRDFDVEKGMFTDAEGYEEAPAAFPPMGEGGA